MKALRTPKRTVRQRPEVECDEMLLIVANEPGWYDRKTGVRLRAATLEEVAQVQANDWSDKTRCVCGGDH